MLAWTGSGPPPQPRSTGLQPSCCPLVAHAQWATLRSQGRRVQPASCLPECTHVLTLTAKLTFRYLRDFTDTHAHAPPRPTPSSPRLVSGWQEAGRPNTPRLPYTTVHPSRQVSPQHARGTASCTERRLHTHSVLRPESGMGVHRRASPTGATGGVHVLSPGARAGMPMLGSYQHTQGKVWLKEGEVQDSGRGAGGGGVSSQSPPQPARSRVLRPHLEVVSQSKTRLGQDAEREALSSWGSGRDVLGGLGPQEVRRGQSWAAPGP